MSELTPDMLRELVFNTRGIWGEGSVLMEYADAWKDDRNRLERIEQVIIGFEAWLTTTDGRITLDEYRTVLEGTIMMLKEALEYPDE